MTSNEVLELVARIKFDARELERGLTQASQKAKDFASGISNNFGTKLGNALSSFGRGIQQVGRGITNIGKTASVVTAGVGAVLGSAFNKAKSYIVTYESAMNTFKNSAQIGEDGAKTLYKSLLGIAENSSYAREHMMLAGQAMVSMGLDADKTTRYTQAITDSCAKMGRSGEDVQGLAWKFAQMSLQTHLYNNDLNELMTYGIPVLDILAVKYGVSREEIQKMASQGLIPATEALETITSALEETNKQSDYFRFSAAGAAKELKEGSLTGTLDSINTSLRTFSLRLLNLDPETDEGVENIKKLNKALSKFGEVLKNVGAKFSFVGDWIAKGLENITTFLDNFNKALESMPQEQLEFIARIVAMIAASGPALIILGTVVKKVGDAFVGLGRVISWFSKANVIEGIVNGFNALVGACGSVGAALGVVAAVITAVVSVFIFLRENWDKVVQTFTGWLEKTGILKSFEKLREKLGVLWEKLGSLKDLFVVIGGIIMGVLYPTIVTLMGLFNGIVEALSGVITFLEGVVDILAGIGEILMGIFTLDKDKIMEGFELVFNGLLEMFTGFFDTLWGFAHGFFEGVWSAITSFFEAFFPEFGSWLLNIGNELSVWFGNMGVNISNWFSNLGVSISSWFSSIGTSVSSWLSNIGVTVSNWFGSTWNTISKWFVGTWESITNWFSELLYKLSNTLSIALGTLAKWGVEAYNWVTREIPKIINTIIRWFSELPSKVWNWLQNTLQKISTWGSQTISKGRTVASNFVNSVINIITSLPSRVWSFLQSTIQRVSTWGSQMIERGRSATINLVNSIINAISSLPSRMFEIGKNIVSGIWNGISNSFGWILDKVRSFANGILDGIKSALGIHSPSKVFEQEVGVNIALGVQSGWEKTIDSVIGTMQKGLNTKVAGSFSKSLTGELSFEKNMSYGINPYQNSEQKEKSILSLLEELKFMLSDYLPVISNRKLVLDSGAIVGELSPQIDYQLGEMTRLRERGN